MVSAFATAFGRIGVVLALITFHDRIVVGNHLAALGICRQRRVARRHLSALLQTLESCFLIPGRRLGLNGPSRTTAAEQKGSRQGSRQGSLLTSRSHEKPFQL